MISVDPLASSHDSDEDNGGFGRLGSRENSSTAFGGDLQYEVPLSHFMSWWQRSHN